MQVPAVPPENRPSVIERHLVVEPHAFDGRGRGEHFLHARSAFGPFVANHDYVAGLDLPVDNPLISLGFRLENDGRAGVFQHLRPDAGRFDYGPLWREVAIQNDQPALLAVGVVDRSNAVERVESEFAGVRSRTDLAARGTFIPSGLILPPGVTAANSRASGLSSLPSPPSNHHHYYRYITLTAPSFRPPTYPILETINLCGFCDGEFVVSTHFRNQRQSRHHHHD